MSVKKLHDFVIPSYVQDTDTLAVILNELRKFDRQSKSALNLVAIIQLVLTFLTVICGQRSTKSGFHGIIIHPLDSKCQDTQVPITQGTVIVRY